MSVLDWEWLREREYSLRVSALADDSCCNRSRFFQSRIRSSLVDPRRLSIVYSRTQRPKPIPGRMRRSMPVVTITGPSGLTKDAKKQLIEESLHVLTETYHKVEDFASNGFIQTENPDMVPFAAALQ